MIFIIKGFWTIVFNKDEDNSPKTLNNKQQSGNIKYSYLIQIICPQLYGFK